jgi:hypothetical protein
LAAFSAYTLKHSGFSIQARSDDKATASERNCGYCSKIAANGRSFSSSKEAPADVGGAGAPGVFCLSRRDGVPGLLAPDVF